LSCHGSHGRDCPPRWSNKLDYDFHSLFFIFPARADAFEMFERQGITEHAMDAHLDPFQAAQ
jgi:hypothetical protein